MSAFTSTTISCFYDRFLLVLYSRLSYSCRASFFVSIAVVYPIRETSWSNFFGGLVSREPLHSGLSWPKICFSGKKSSRLPPSGDRLKSGSQPMCSSRWTIPQGAAVLTIPFGPTWNIEWNYQAFTPFSDDRPQELILPTLLFTDKAVPANRECGLYDIPEKKH